MPQTETAQAYFKKRVDAAVERRTRDLQREVDRLAELATCLTEERNLAEDALEWMRRGDRPERTDRALRDYDEARAARLAGQRGGSDG